jgi:hypothetical protein
VVAALLKHNAPPEVAVAQLPLGTANDLASVTQIPLVSSFGRGIAIIRRRSRHHNVPQFSQSCIDHPLTTGLPVADSL